MPLPKPDVDPFILHSILLISGVPWPCLVLVCDVIHRCGSDSFQIHVSRRMWVPVPVMHRLAPQDWATARAQQVSPYQTVRFTFLRRVRNSSMTPLFEIPSTPNMPQPLHVVPQEPFPKFETPCQTCIIYATHTRMYTFRRPIQNARLPLDWRLSILCPLTLFSSHSRYILPRSLAQKCKPVATSLFGIVTHRSRALTKDPISPKLGTC